MVDVAARDVNLLAGIVPVPTVRDGWWEVDVAVGPAEVPPDLELAVFVIAAPVRDQRGRSGRPEAYFGSENSDTRTSPAGSPSRPGRGAHARLHAPGFA